MTMHPPWTIWARMGQLHPGCMVWHPPGTLWAPRADRPQAGEGEPLPHPNDFRCRTAEHGAREVGESQAFMCHFEPGIGADAAAV